MKCGQKQYFKSEPFSKQMKNVFILRYYELCSSTSFQQIEEIFRFYVRSQNKSTKTNGSLVLKTNGSLVLKTNGSLVLKTNGSLVLKTNGSMVLMTNGTLVLKTNGTLVLKTNGSLVLKSNDTLYSFRSSLEFALLSHYFLDTNYIHFGF